MTRRGDPGRGRRAVRPRLSHEAGRGRWLLSYADLVTLLFALFAVLAATGLSRPAEPAPATPAPSPLAVLAAEPEATASPEPVVEDPLADELRRELAELGAEVSSGGEGMVSVTLAADPLLFRSGDTELQTKGRSILRRIARIARSHDLAVTVEGHTDDQPLLVRYPSTNWELSVLRATAVVEYLVKKEGLPPDRLCAAGYGEHRPRASNQTEEGRRRNRRVEVILARPERAAKVPVAGK